MKKLVIILFAVAALTSVARAEDVPLPQERPTNIPTTTAVYDISAHTVYLPDGRKLEAHSGLGPKRDNPKYVNQRMRGSTPPNVYDLTLREHKFHGVKAIRLNPKDENKMYGRDGILAHPYMRTNGQSSGCVVFKDYAAFLAAFLEGQVKQLIVVVGNVSDAVEELVTPTKHHVVKHKKHHKKYRHHRKRHKHRH